MSITPLLGWRDYLHVRSDKVRGDSEYYLTQAGVVRDLVATVLQVGLSEGAEQALTDLAEEDSVDFCIMIDLAAGLDIPGVEPLVGQQKQMLSQFLAQEPWRSLEVDTEIAVCLAMLRVYGESEAETIWHMGDPHLLKSISRAFEGVNKEQLARFVAEINTLAAQRAISFDNELCALSLACAESAANRLGTQAPSLFN
ncbi:MAG: hypothetical protein ACI9ON_002482 [Limisphaerales bacterium]|jgi:hypothetical protein